MNCDCESNQYCYDCVEQRVNVVFRVEIDYEDLWTHVMQDLELFFQSQSFFLRKGIGQGIIDHGSGQGIIDFPQ